MKCNIYDFSLYCFMIKGTKSDIWIKMLKKKVQNTL